MTIFCNYGSAILMHLNSSGLCNWCANQISFNLTLGYFYSYVEQYSQIAMWFHLSVGGIGYCNKPAKNRLTEKKFGSVTYIDRHSGRMAAPLPWSVKAADFGFGRA